MRSVSIVCLVAVGCGLESSGRMEEDGEGGMEAGEDQVDQVEAEPDAVDDVVDTYDRGDVDAGDEDDGWTDPTGEDGGDDAPAADDVVDTVGWICDNDCGPWRMDNGYCEDGGQGSSSSDCGYGRDCSDCGPRPRLDATT